MSKRSIDTRRALAEKAYPSRVDVPAPADGFGLSLNRMVAWCRAYAPISEMHGGQGDVARFYFADPQAAHLFVVVWGGIQMSEDQPYRPDLLEPDSTLNDGRKTPLPSVPMTPLAKGGIII